MSFYRFLDEDLVEELEKAHSDEDWAYYDEVFEELRQRGYFL